MSFNIQDFISSLSSNGTAFQNQFRVIVLPPPVMLGAFTNLSLTTGVKSILFGGNSIPLDPRHISLRVESAEIPGRSIATAEHRYYGSPRKIGYGAIYNDINCTVLCSSDLKEKMFFQNWQDAIVGDHRSRGVTSFLPFDADEFSSGFRKSRSEWDIGYYDDYVSTILIEQYDPSGILSYQCALREAYPLTVNNLSLAWAASDTQKLNVTFAYRHFVDNSLLQNISNNIRTLNNFIPSSGDLANVINQIPLPTIF